MSYESNATFAITSRPVQNSWIRSALRSMLTLTEGTTQAISCTKNSMTENAGESTLPIRSASARSTHSDFPTGVARRVRVLTRDPSPDIQARSSTCWFWPHSPTQLAAPVDPVTCPCWATRYVEIWWFLSRETKCRHQVCRVTLGCSRPFTGTGDFHSVCGGSRRELCDIPGTFPPPYRTTRSSLEAPQHASASTSTSFSTGPRSAPLEAPPKRLRATRVSD